MNSVIPSGIETHDFVRLRIVSHRFNVSVTADISEEAWERVDPSAVAREASDDLFILTYVGQPEGNCPTFTVLQGRSSYPKDPEAAMRALKTRIEDLFDVATGDQLVR